MAKLHPTIVVFGLLTLLAVGSSSSIHSLSASSEEGSANHSASYVLGSVSGTTGLANQAQVVRTASSLDSIFSVRENLGGIVLTQHWVNVEVTSDDIPPIAKVKGLSVEVRVDVIRAPGLDAQISLQKGYEITVPLEGRQGLARTSEPIHLLDGFPARRTWKIAIRPHDPSLIGHTAYLNLVIDFGLDFQSILPSLASETTTSTLSHNMPLLPLVSTPPGKEQQDMPADMMRINGWQVITQEGFEGGFPTDGWSVIDKSQDGFQRSWGADDYRAFSGTHSAWVARSGVDGLDPEFSPYPSALDSWMYYGPIDLSEAIDFNTDLYFSLNSVVFKDYLYVLVSHGGIWYGAYYWSGQFGDAFSWRQIPLQSFIGFSDVYVALVFQSQVGGNANGWKGAFVDDITIWKQVAAPPTPTPVSINYLPLVAK